MSKLKRLLELVDDLNWDYDRMSSSGQETMDKINHILEEIGNPKVVKERELILIKDLSEGFAYNEKEKKYKWVENLKSDIKGD